MIAKIHRDKWTKGCHNPTGPYVVLPTENYHHDIKYNGES